jgi:hypothetical protein
MPRHFVLAAVVLLIAIPLAALAPAAPVPKDANKPKLYHPVTKGAKWVYVCSGEDAREFEHALEVTAVEDGKDGAKLVTVTAGEQIKTIYTLSVSEKGLCLLRTDGTDLDKPFWHLKLPHTDGQVWKLVAAAAGETRMSKFAAYGPERVEVPAGVFQAIRVESFFDEQLAATTWFAEDIGITKAISQNIVMSLRSFTPGK